MTEANRSQAAPPDKMVIFTAAEAPTLEETGMMDAMSFILFCIPISGIRKKPAATDPSIEPTVLAE